MDVYKNNRAEHAASGSHLNVIESGEDLHAAFVPKNGYILPVRTGISDWEL